MTVTELLSGPLSTAFLATPDQEGKFNFPPGIGTGDPFLDGVHIHAGLRLLRYDSPHLSPRYKRLWPVLTSIRSAVLTLGAERISPEVSIARNGLTGRVDIRASGARGIGHVELKVVKRLPDAPRHRDLRQTALYLSLSERRRPAWAAIIYLCMGDGQARYYVFSEAIPSLIKASIGAER